MKWISVKDKLPKVKERVQICYERKVAWQDKPVKIVTTAFYVDGKTPEEDLLLDFSEMSELLKYDAVNDRYLAPEGWYEELSSISAEYFCILDKSEIVTHWKPLSEPPEEE